MFLLAFRIGMQGVSTGRRGDSRGKGVSLGGGVGGETTGGVIDSL